MENEPCGVILVNKHKGVTSHGYSLPCVKGGGDSPFRGNVAKRQKGTASVRGHVSGGRIV